MTNYVRTFTVSAARVLLAIVFTAAVAADARAQESKFFVDVHGGAQVGMPVLDSDATFEIYNETAAVGTRHELGNEPYFDVRIGYHYDGRLGFGLAISAAQTTYNGAAVARIPNPVFAGRPKQVEATVEDLTRREVGVHLQVLWIIPMADKYELTLSGGPSFITIDQPVIDVSVEPGTQNAVITTPKERGLVPAVNFGADLTYRLTPKFSAGLFGRFTGGKKDFDQIKNVSTESEQVGVAVRIKF